MSIPPTHGYSGKPLWQKLGLKPGLTYLSIDPPDHLPDLLAGAACDVTREPEAADIVHLFAADRAALAAGLEGALARVAPGGMLWVSWPKKSSALWRDLTEDDLRAAMLPMAWVDVKVCAVDADWSGLKFLRRRQ